MPANQGRQAGLLRARACTCTTVHTYLTRLYTHACTIAYVPPKDPFFSLCPFVSVFRRCRTRRSAQNPRRSQGAFSSGCRERVPTSRKGLRCRSRSASRTMSRSTREWPPPRAHARSRNTHGHPAPLSVCLTARCPSKHQRTHERRDVAHIAARSARLDGYSRAAYSRYTIHVGRGSGLSSRSRSRRGSSSFVVALTFGSLHSPLLVATLFSHSVPLRTFSRSFVYGAHPGYCLATGSEATRENTSREELLGKKTPIEIWYRTDAGR